MATRFAGWKPDEQLKCFGEDIRTMRVDPNHSRFGEIPIDVEFALDIAARGQLEPGLVRKDSEGNPVLFVGNRRRLHILWINDHLEEVNHLLGDRGLPTLSEPLAFVAKFKPVTQQQAEEMQVSENIQRADLRPVDKAVLAQRYASVYGKDLPEIGNRLRLTPARVRQLLDLFSLGQPVLELVAAGKLTEGGARGLKGLPEEVIASVVEEIRGGARAHQILARIREQHRERGRTRPRSGREIVKQFEEIGGPLGADLVAWASGDPTAGTLQDILKRVARG